MTRCVLLEVLVLYVCALPIRRHRFVDRRFFGRVTVGRRAGVPPPTYEAGSVASVSAGRVAYQREVTVCRLCHYE